MSVDRHRLIVGIDYGTTFSGISYVSTARAGTENVDVLTIWPGQAGLTERKVPTRIAYIDENKDNRNIAKMTKNAWGYLVKPHMRSCSWTKLLLDMTPEDRSDIKPELNNELDNGILRLPDQSLISKSAVDVCQDFLELLCAHFTAEISRRIGENYLASTPMDCWITVPAVWSDKARNATRRAAKKAGFGRRVNDTINIISEPEAAAIATLKKYTLEGAQNPPEENEHVLVCDCGGGTVDITTYCVNQLKPTLLFEEVCIGTGEKCGSTYIDRNLYALMHQRFGEHFAKLDVSVKGPGSYFMREWERVKRSFGMPEADYEEELGPINMTGVGSSDYYNPATSMVVLTPKDVAKLFEPIVKQIIELIESQTRRVAEKQRTVDRLILVGGFGESQHLFNRIQAWCNDGRNILVLCPEDPQAAIVRGAALRGLEGTAPLKRRCRRHYGIAIGMTFREGKDPEEKSYSDEWENRKKCHGRMSWMIQKGTKIHQQNGVAKKKIVENLDRRGGRRTTLILYSCALDLAPEYSDHERVERVGTIVIDYRNIDVGTFEHRRASAFGRTIYHVESSLEINFGADSGRLEVRNMINGQVTGKTSIRFD